MILSCFSEKFAQAGYHSTGPQPVFVADGQYHNLAPGRINHTHTHRLGRKSKAVRVSRTPHELSAALYER